MRIRDKLLRGAAVVALTTGGMVGTAAAQVQGAFIDNGTILLGINATGDLNFEKVGFGRRGLTFIPSKDVVTPGSSSPGGDALAPGCACEGWGAGDFGVFRGFAGRTFGVENVKVDSFTTTGTPSVAGATLGSTGSSAVSVTSIAKDSNPGLQVTHDFRPSASVNLYRVEVTLKNAGSGPVADLRYRRVMDWDIPPTEFNELVTISGLPASRVLRVTNDGFATGDITVPLDPIPVSGGTPPPNTNVDRAGPGDHGSAWDFGFGTLAPGAQQTFVIFYGAAPNRAAALAALASIGAEVYSLGEPSNTTDGTPNTFIFAFAGVGGTPLGGGDVVPVDSPVTPVRRNVLPSNTRAMFRLAEAAVRGHFDLLGMRLDGSDGGGERTYGLPGAPVGTPGALHALSDFSSAPVQFSSDLGRGGRNVETREAEVRDAFGIQGMRAFLSTGYEFGDLRRIRGQTGFRFDGPRITFGLDYAFVRPMEHVESIIVGAAFGLKDVDARSNIGSFVDASSILGSLYAGVRLMNGLYADGAVHFGETEFKQGRTVSGVTFRSSPDSSQVGGSLRVGYDFVPIPLSVLASEVGPPATFTWGPFGRLDIVRTRLDGYAEIDAATSVPGFTVAPASETSPTSTLGVRARLAIPQSWGHLSFHTLVGWEHRFDTATRVHFTDLFDLTSAANVPLGNSDGLRAGVRAAATIGDTATFALDYNVLHTPNDFTNHSFTARVRVAF